MKIPASSPVAKYAERKERNPKIAVFDYFAGTKEAPKHGDQVEDIILRTSGLGDRKVQNFQNAYKRETSFDDVYEASASQFKERLRTYTIESVRGFYDATRKNLDTILENPKNKVRVINQSQSQTPARLAGKFISKAFKDEKFRMKMKEVFDLPAGSHKETVAEALLNEVNNTFENSRYIATARKDYLESAKQAYQAGIAHVVTAGNLGRMAKFYAKSGVEVPEGAYQSVLANEYTTVIGATASQGTITTRDDTAATFSSVDAGAEFSMHGVNVEVEDGDPLKDSFKNGTSFAAPQATALIYEIFEENPKLKVSDMEDILYKSTVPVQGDERQIGAGQVDPERAMYLAEQSRFVSGRSFELLADVTKNSTAHYSRKESGVSRFDNLASLAVLGKLIATDASHA